MTIPEKERWRISKYSCVGQPVIYKEGESETHAIPVCIVAQRSLHPMELHPETDRLAKLILQAPAMLDALHRALIFINGHEVAHGRPFGTGNEIRDVIQLATGVRPESNVDAFIQDYDRGDGIFIEAAI
jgi:hypothetical protein